LWTHVIVPEQRFGECSSRFSLSNETKPGGGGRALKVSVLSRGGGGRVWRNQSGTNVSYAVYTDDPGTVRHVNTVASAHAIANKLNKPMVIGEFGMPVTDEEGTDYPAETLASRHTKMTAKMDAYRNAGAACHVLWTWMPETGNPPIGFAIHSTGPYADPLIAEVRAR
jgi:hypothetical protein